METRIWNELVRALVLLGKGLGLSLRSGLDPQSGPEPGSPGHRAFSSEQRRKHRPTLVLCSGLHSGSQLLTCERKAAASHFLLTLLRQMTAGGGEVRGAWEGLNTQPRSQSAPPPALAEAAIRDSGQARPSCSSLWPGWSQTLSPNPLLCSPRLSKSQNNFFFFLNQEKTISKQTLKTVAREHKNGDNVLSEGMGEVGANFWLGLACCLGVPVTPQQTAPSSLPWTLQALRNKSEQERKTSPFLQIGASSEDKTLGQGSC